MAHVSAETLCSGKARVLKKFAEAIFDLKHVDKPHYEKLKHLLVTSLLQQDKSPDSVFDWSKFESKNATPEPLTIGNEYSEDANQFEEGIDKLCPLPSLPKNIIIKF